jgi:hypothetical protein
MALVRIDEKTLVQKIKFFIIGHEKPNWATRGSVIAGFVLWFYYLIYFSIIFLSILFVDTLEDPQLIKSTFGKIGGKYNFNIDYANFGWQAIDVIFYHALVTIALLCLSLVGLIFIYRRRKTGYLLYLTGNCLVIVFSLLFLGWTYVQEQITVIDKTIFMGITGYFFVAMFFLKRNKATIDPVELQS